MADNVAKMKACSVATSPTSKRKRATPIGSVSQPMAAVGPITLLIAVVFFLFEVVLIAGLQAFIFATLTAIYLGGAVAEGH